MQFPWVGKIQAANLSVEQFSFLCSFPNLDSCVNLVEIQKNP